MKAITAIVSVAAVLGTGVAAPLHAQEIDKPQAIAAAVQYAMPLVLQGVRKRCGGTLSPDGYLAKNGDALEAKYAELSSAAWPQAKAALLELGESRKSKGADLLAEMDDENLKPMVDGILGALIAQELRVEHCADVERGLALIDPLPAENFAGLVGFFAELVERDTKRRNASKGRRR